MRGRGSLVPASVIANFTGAQAEAVCDWWGRLDEPIRCELASRWGRSAERSERFEGGSDAGTDGRRGLLAGLRGRFVDPEDAAENEMWTEALRDYITALDIPFFLEERKFHICRAHPEARAVLATGVIRPGFTCPLLRASCPLAQAAALRPGTAIHLTAGA